MNRNETNTFRVFEADSLKVSSKRGMLTDGMKLILALLTGLLITTEAAEYLPKIRILPGAELLNRLNNSHPRLLASASDFDRLKSVAKSDLQLKLWLSKLHAEALHILAAPPSRYEIPDGLRLLATSRQVLRRVYILGLLYQLEDDSRYANRAWKELEAAAAFADWNPRHFLDTAEMTHAFAIGYDWFAGCWSAEQKQTLRVALLEKGLKPALNIYRSHTGWPRARHNWNQVCNGGIGMGALAIADEEPQLCGEILSEALQSIQVAMAEFAPDGAWQEGPGYWNYATIYNVVLLAALESALGTDFGLAGAQGFSKTGYFPLYLTGPLGRTFNYADGGDHAIHAPQLLWLAHRFDQPALAAYEFQHAVPDPLDVLWYEEAKTVPNLPALPLNKRFRGAEIVTLRSGWDSKATFIGFKGGDNKANHSHLDLGDFILDAMGIRWAVDLGADDYNLPGYFGNQRWNFYRLRAEGQNTLVINPNAEPDQDPRAEAHIIRYNSNPQHAFAVADLTAAYAKKASRVWRGIALVNKREILIQDEILSENPAEVWWFMHTPAAVQIKKDGRSAILEQVGTELRVELLSPPNGRLELLPAEPLPTSAKPAAQNKNEQFRKLTIHLPDVTDIRIVVLMVPNPNGSGPPEAAKLVSLSDW